MASDKPNHLDELCEQDRKIAQLEGAISSILMVVCVSDSESNETLYVDGKHASIEGNTVYAVDIAQHAEGRAIWFSRVTVDLPIDEEWPSTFDELKMA